MKFSVPALFAICAAAILPERAMAGRRLVPGGAGTNSSCGSSKDGIVGRIWRKPQHISHFLDNKTHTRTKHHDFGCLPSSELLRCQGVQNFEAGK